jgi:hypothetical protein
MLEGNRVLLRPGFRYSLFWLWLLPLVVSAAERPVLYNHVSAKRTGLDDFVAKHYANRYRVVEFSDQDHRWTFPKGISGFGPSSPAYLEGRCISGHALLIYVISLDGRSRDIFVVESTHPHLAALAMRKVDAWKTRPGLLDGKPVSSVAATNIKFDCPGDRDAKQ